jgi:hypothetical protein
MGACGMHAQRYRRHGDYSFVTDEKTRRANNRAAQPRLGTAKGTTYKKMFGKHEHRVIAENVLGRKLVHGEVVHHLDGNKHNNDPANLSVMTQSDHIRLHFGEMMLERKAKRGY